MKIQMMDKIIVTLYMNVRCFQYFVIHLYMDIVMINIVDDKWISTILFMIVFLLTHAVIFYVVSNSTGIINTSIIYSWNQ